MTIMLITRGKYSGESTKKIVIIDPSYVVWCVDKKIMLDFFSTADYEKAIDILFQKEKMKNLKRHNRLAYNWHDEDYYK